MGKKILLLAFSLIMLSVPMVFADTIDLATSPPAAPGYTVAAGDGTFWKVIDVAPTGTGIFEPFLRLDANTNKNNFSLGTDIEAGLNTNAANPGVYNDVGSPHTHAVLWSNVGTITNPVGLPAGTYYQLTLDINEPANSTQRFLSLNALQIYQGSTATATNISQLGTPLYDITTFTGPSGTKIPPVLMDYTLASSGSGEADVEFFIPISMISHSLDYFYFYTEMGGSPGGDYGAQAGFEEWRVLTGQAQVPEPSALLLLGGGLVLVGIIRRRSRQK